MVKIGSFDPGAHEGRDSFDPLPPGWYAMHVHDTRRKTARSGDDYLEVEFLIDEAVHPTHKGRRVWDRLNLWNSNATAARIAGSTLAEICRACGVGAGADFDTADLHHKRLAVKIRIQPADGQYEAKNEPRAYDTVVSRFKPGAPVNRETQTPSFTQPDGRVDAPPWKS